jgi:hypothetical protein
VTRLAIVGDIAILLLFAAIGRSSHNEGGGVLATIAVAAPFLVGWFVAAAWTRPYARQALRSVRNAVIITLRTWLAGGIIGLVIRSILEWRITPLTFVVIALGFNGVFLCAWHAALARFATRCRMQSSG